MTYTGVNSENTKILHGIENTISYGVRHLQIATEKLDPCTDKNGPSIVIESRRYLKKIIEKLGITKNLTSILISNYPLYLDYYHKIFDKLWNNGINAKSMIEDLEKGRIKHNKDGCCVQP